MNYANGSIPRVYSSSVPLHAIYVRHRPVRPVRPLPMLKQAKKQGTEHRIETLEVSDRRDRLFYADPIGPRMATSVDVREQTG